jgi:four helix bundle protein
VTNREGGVRLKSYKDLDIYRESFELAMEMHELSLTFPRFEKFEEGSQLRKSSKGIPSCIAEGWGRRYYKNELVKFLIYALASCDETKVHLDFAARCKYITEEQHQGYTKRYDILGKKINRYMQYVERSYLNPREKMAEGSASAENSAPTYLFDE